MSLISVEVKSMRWTGHVFRMDDTRTCVAVMMRRPEGRKKVWRPKKHGERQIRWTSWNHAKQETESSTLPPYGPRGPKKKVR